MSTLNNLKIWLKVALSFGLLATMFIGFGLYALDRLGRVNAETVEIAGVWLPSVETVSDLQYLLTRHRTLVARHVLEDEDVQLAEVERMIGSALDQFRTDLKKYEPLVHAAEDRRMLADLNARLPAYLQQVDTILGHSRRHDDRAATAQFRVSLGDYEAIGKLLDKLVDVNVHGAEKSAKHAAETYASAQHMMMGAVALVLLLCCGITLGMVAGVSKPVTAMTAALRALAGGDTKVAIPAQGRKDEIGAMAETAEVFRQNLLEAERLRAEQEAMKERAAAEKTAAMNKMADEFEASVMAVVKQVAGASTELQTTAQAMSSTAEETNRQASGAAAAAEQASSNVRAVAAAAEELGSSIEEIARQMAESTSIAGRGAEEAQRSNVQVQSLAEAAEKIGDVVRLISDIAGQTNLLALNATIEAARAGEAGRGFAVVASEVKALANQTAKATEDIAAQVKAIQGATADSVQAIGGIAQTIGRINEITTAVAAAVEEQGAATQEIARNVQQAATGTTDVSANVSGVTEASAQTGAAATQLLGAASELSQNSELLRKEVDGFVAKVRAA